MNNKSNSIEDKFRIIISVGDESGIGPEIILKALFSKEIPHNLDFIIVGSKNNLENTYKNLKSLGVKNICLLYTSPSPRDMRRSRMPSSA